MKQIIFSALLAACVVLSPQHSSAQSAERKAAQQERREDLIKRIEQLKHEKITAALALDADAAAKFFEIYRPAEKEIQVLVRQRNEELQKLALASKSGEADAEAEQYMATIKSLNERIAAREERVDGELKSILSPSQRAKLLVFEHEFNQRIRQEVAKRQLARNGGLRALRQSLRQQRIQRRLLRKEAQEKSPGP